MHLSMSQVASYLGVSKATAARYIANGYLTRGPAAQGATRNHSGVSLADVAALKAKLDNGWVPPRPRTRGVTGVGGWKRPDLVGKVRGMALVNQKLKAIENGVNLILVAMQGQGKIPASLVQAVTATQATPVHEGGQDDDTDS